MYSVNSSHKGRAGNFQKRWVRFETSPFFALPLILDLGTLVVSYVYYAYNKLFQVEEKDASSAFC